MRFHLRQRELGLLALRLNSAACSLKAARHAQALVHSDAALALAPGSAKALFRRGSALHGLGRLAEAEEVFSSVLARSPTSREAHARLQEVRASMQAAGGSSAASAAGRP